MKTVIRLLASAVQRMPWLIIGVTIVLVGALGPLAGRAEIAQGNEGFAPDNAEIQASERIADLFGTDSQESVFQVVIRSENGEGDVITRDALVLVEEITAAIYAGEAAPNLAETEVRPAVVSYLAPAFQALAAQGVEPSMVPGDAEVKQAYLGALQSPEFAEQGGFVTSLVSEGANLDEATAPAGMMLVFLTQDETGSPDEAFDAAIELDSNVADAVRSVDVPAGYEVRPFSFSLLFEDQDDFTGEVGQLFGFAALIIFVILGFVYWLKPGGNTRWFQSGRRTLADVLLTLFTIFAAIGMTQGLGYLMVQAGIIGSFNPVTQIIPILLIGLGVDYGIHVTSRYREEAGKGADVDRSVRTAIGTVGVALALATITTAVGFLTNIFNPVPALKDFGILSATGIVISFLLMLTFVPSVREVLDRRAQAGGRLPSDGMKAGGDRLLPQIMEKTSVLAERAAIPTLVVALVLGGAGVWGLTQLETRFSFTDFLPEDAPAVQTLDIIEGEFGGGFGESTQVLVEGDDLATVETHNALVEAVGNLATVPNVVSFDSPVGPVASAESPIGVIQQLVSPGPDGQPVSPEFAQEAFGLGLGEDLTVSGSADVAAIWAAAAEAAPEQWAQVAHSTAGATDAVLVDIQTQAGEQGAGELREDLVTAFEPVAEAAASVIPTSQQIISDVIVTSLASSQTTSLLITLVIATLVLVVSFWIENRRPFLGVITMLPVALVVFWTYGLMYVTGIPFGPVTATLAALAVGIGVPFTIHIARRFEEDRNRYHDLDDAIRSTTRHTGGALAGSAFTTMAGFGILITSSLTPFQQMGQVTVYAIGLSLIGAILVLPSLLALWEGWHRRRGRTPTEKETVPVA